MLESPRVPLLSREKILRYWGANPVFGWVCTKHAAPVALHFPAVYSRMRAVVHTLFVDKAGSGGHNKKASLEL
jgi:hypothetical protein